MSNELPNHRSAAPTVEKTETPAPQPSKFPTEIVTLPSKGLLYPKDNPLASGKVEMKYMTAKEEDILTTQSYIQQGVVLDKLFQSLIVGNGEGQRINYNDLLVGDKNAIMIAARILGYGKEYVTEVTTPSGKKQEETIDLTTIQDRPFNEELIEPGVNEFSFQLPASKRVITFKVLSHRDNDAIESEMKGLKKLQRKTGGADPQLTTRLAHAIVSVDGEDDKAKIRNFVREELYAIDSRALREYMKTVQPDVDMDIEFIDEETGEPFTLSLPIGVNFFWPDA